MPSEIILDHMEISAVIKDIRKIVTNSLLSETQKRSYLNRLDSIEDRWYDTNLYVGIVGEFSSGKSTLINSLIGRDYFVTNSLQGTTTVVTSICYGNTINLELRYKNGDVEKYSSNKLSMIEKFLPDDYAKLSFTDKVKIKAGDFFGVNGKDDFMLKIFDIVTTSDSLSKELDEVTVHYPSEFLKTGIVLLDTPGTDSLNPTHTEITINALANKCNIAFVIIPSGSPVSLSLSDFISDNLNHCIDDCHFLLTKIELIRKEKERDELAKWVFNQLKNNLGVENPHVIVAPTLLSLEEKKITEPSGLLDNLKQETKNSLVEKYDNEIAGLFNHLTAAKHQLIISTVCKLIKDQIEQILNSLKDLSEEKQQSLDYKRANRTPSLDSLVTRIDRDALLMNREVVLERIRTRFSNASAEFEDTVNDIISEATTKNEIQFSIHSEQSIKKGEELYKECFEYAVEQLNSMVNCYTSEISKFEEDFGKAYSIDTLEFIPNIDPVIIKDYKNKFSTFSITTFPLKRMFIKKEKIREEMRGAVKSYINTIFEKLLNHYSSKIDKADEKINKQVDKLLQNYLKKFSKQINSRIKHEIEIETSVSEEISAIATHMQDIKQIPQRLA